MSDLREHLGKLSPEQLERLALRLQKRAPAAPAKATIPKTCDDGPCPLSYSQERLWLLDQLDPDSAAYNLAWALRIHGALDLPALRKALDELVVRQSALRTVIRQIESNPFQFILPSRPVELTLHDLTGDPGEQNVRRVLTAESRRPFDLANDQMLRAALLELVPNDHVLLLTVHHVAADGWSRGILLRELSALYTAFANGKGPSLPELPVQYADFANWQRQGSETGSMETQISFWEQQLKGTSGSLDIPADHQRPPEQSYRGAKVIRALSDDVAIGLRALCKKEQVTPFMALLVILQVLLHRYTGESDIAIGTPVANRTRVETEGLIGCFVNTVVMRTDSSGEPTVRELLRRAREVALGAFAHQEVPFEKVLDALQPPRWRNRSPIFQVMMALHNAPNENLLLANLRAEIVEVETGTTPFDLFLEIVERPVGMALKLSYCTDLFEPDTASRLLGHFETLLRGAIQNPNLPVSQLPLLTDAETQKLLVDWNETRTEYPLSCPYQLFEAQAARTPDAAAIVQEGRRWSYAELNQHSDRIARHLRALGVAPGALVVICVERSLELLAGLLGIWKAGGAYLPLDPAYPQQRLSFILQDAGPTVVLTEAHLRGMFDESGVPVAILSECLAGEPSNPNVQTIPPSLDDLAYVIYTSGSTGKPKGVAIRHRSVTNLVNSFCTLLKPGTRDVILATTTISFDIAGLELYVPLSVGACVAMVSRELATDGLGLAKNVEQVGATIIQATPATWQMLLDAGWTGHDGLKILCGGEALPEPLAKRLMQQGEVWNVYGPTETTIWSTVARVAEGDGCVPIGRPLDNTDLYVLDKQRQLVPIGVPGELYIGGDGLAQGYWHRPDLTAEKFVPHPFSAVPGSRLYRTGDSVRYMRDGNVEYLGRIDNQVKIRGFRIELGEVESVLGGHAAVRQCAVVAREDVPGDKRLVGYVELREGKAPSSADLRAHLKQELPDYMVPALFVVMEKLPLTPNGKIDRKALPAPDERPVDVHGEYIAPRDAVEQALANIWAKTLGVKRVGLHDDFFALGGHSLAAVRLLFEVQKFSGKTLPLATLFQASTVEAFAEILRKDGWAPSWSSLVPIQPKGSKPPLYLIHGAEGNVLFYRPVTRYLGPDQPVYGLQSQGLNGEGLVNKTVPEMAAHYVKEIRTLQPHGPYFLGGYCLGGAIAFEMAQQLTALGEKVGNVFLLESYNPGVPSTYSLIFPRKPVLYLQDVWFHIANAFSVSADDRRKFLGAKFNVELSRIGIKVRAMWDGFVQALSGKKPAPYPHLLVTKVNDEAADQYRPQPYSGRVSVIRPTGHFLGYGNASCGWDAVVNGGLEVHQLPMYSKGMLVEPFCRLLGDALRTLLEA